MTRKGALGAVAVVVLALLSSGAWLAPRWVEQQIKEEAAERGIEIDAEVDATALGVTIERVVLERGDTSLVCTDGQATMTARAIFNRDRKLHRVTFEQCVVSQVRNPQAVDDTQTGGSASVSRIDRVFGALDSLVEVEHLSVATVRIARGTDRLVLHNVRGQVRPGDADLLFSLAHTGLVHMAGDVRLQANVHAISLTTDTTALFADADISVAHASLAHDGMLSLSDARISTDIGVADFVNIEVGRTREVTVEGARLQLLPPAPTEPISDRGSLALVPYLAEQFGLGLATQLSFDTTSVVLFVRSIRAMISPPGQQGHISAPVETPPSTTATHQLLDRSTQLRPALVSLRSGIDAIPFDLTLSNISVDGVPGCTEFELQTLRAAPAVLTGHIECDGMTLSLLSTAESTVVSLERLRADRLHARARGLVSLTVEPTLGDGVTALHIESTFVGLGAYHQAVSPEPVELTGSAIFDLTIAEDPATPQVGLEFMGRVGEVPFDGTVTANNERSTWSLRTEGGVSEPTLCSSMWEAAPRGFIPHLEHSNVLFIGSAAPRVRATYEVGNSDSFDMRQDGFMGDCTIESIDEPYDPRVLLEEDYVFTVVEHSTVPIDVGPGAHDYQTMDALPAFVPALMYLSEEIAFLSNPGFSMMLMRRAVRMNLRENRYVYGGSTVTQQLAKNLFFDRKKTLARKFEEAIVVWAMEQWVPKERILELYLNCVEFAPDVYGISAAARHYFDKSPSELTPLETAFLAALKPAPARGERHRRRGHSPDTGWWHERLLVLLTRLVEYGPYIDQAEVDYYAPYVVGFPTSPNFGEVEVAMVPRPKWVATESFTESRARLD